MKLKNLTIAIAMAALGATSFAAQAEDGTSYYGSIRVGVEHLSTDINGVSDDTTKLQNWASRMGFKAETDLGNGMKGFGHYEFGVDTDSADNSNGALSTRKAYLGVKGNFGRIRMGQDYHTFYNTVIAPADLAWWGSSYGAGELGSSTGRTGEALSYDTTMGAVGLGATAYLGDDKYGDGYELGASFGAGPVKVGVGIQDTESYVGTNEDTGKIYGISAGGKMGPAEYGIAYTDRDNVGSSVDLHVGFNKAYIAYGQADLDAGTKPTGVTLGFSHDVGKNALAWYEVQQTDNDAGREDTALRAVLRYNF